MFAGLLRVTLKGCIFCWIQQFADQLNTLNYLFFKVISFDLCYA